MNRERSNILFLVGFFLLAFSSSIAQPLSSTSALYQKFHYQVKQLNQFIDRFNFSEEVVFQNNQKSSRLNNLLSLINNKDNSLTTNPNSLEFVKMVSEDTVNNKLNFTDKNWSVSVSCDFSYHGKIISIDLILKTQSTKGGGLKWVIEDVSSPLFLLEKSETESDIYFINPMNHDIDFSELSKALSSPQNIEQYQSSSNKINKLSAFFVYLKNAELQFKQISTLKYHFYQISGWHFTVENFNRQDFNAGWLISSIQKTH